MTQRHNGGDRDGQGIGDDQLKQLFDDDAFLTELSRGVDPSDGGDALAGLFLELNRQVHAPMPASPDLATLLPEAGDTAPGTTEFAGASATEVVALQGWGSRHRARRHRARPIGGRRVSPFVHGLVGAAAATLVIAGGGTAVYNAGPDSPLYGVSRQIFGGGDDPSVIELASTLAEADSRTANGDVEGARELLEQARVILGEMNQRQNQQSRNSAPEATTETVTVTTSEGRSKESETPTPTTETVTETRTQVHTVTSTVVRPPVQTPQPSPSIPVEPTPDPGDDAGRTTENVPSSPASGS